MSCPLTSLYENFRDHVDRATAAGDTKLYDALDKAADVLEEWKKTHANAGLRIVAISDGKDTASKGQPEKTAAKLQRLNITVDAIQIGNERDQTLHAISKCTGGLIFAPSSLRDALRLLELETLLCQLERPDKPRLRPVVYASDLNHFSRFPRDECSDTSVPKRRVIELTGKVLLLDKVLEKEEAKHASDAVTASLPAIFTATNQSSTTTASPTAHPDRSKRIMREMKALHTGPHPSIDVYPSADEIAKWILIIEGPNGTPYANACWKVYLEFPLQYPNSPPTVRFLTPIKHCNISTYGRVCHSILDRNYTPDVTIKQILDCIYGLLLNPDVSDPLDSALALEFYDASGRYEAQIIAHSKLHASKTRSQWAKELTDQPETEDRSSSSFSSSSSSSSDSHDRKKSKAIRSYNCSFCGKFFSGDAELLRCSTCQKAYYCNRRCQSSHWKKHKTQCKFPQ